ncbi:hypothetical protein C4J65_13745 [Streptomyces sp. CB09001]|nr:hypothetical protein C4J65_13745 [Streptomyces sp. CB09001]
MEPEAEPEPEPEPEPDALSFPAEPFEAVDPFEPFEPFEPVEPVDPFEPVDPSTPFALPAGWTLFPSADAEAVESGAGEPVSSSPSQAVRESAASATVVAANRRVRVIRRADMEVLLHKRGVEASRSTVLRERLL